MPTEFRLPSGNSVAIDVPEGVVVDVTEDAEGNISIMQADSEQVTCTCHSTGKSVTKECPKGSSPLCDCSDPNNPKITC